MATPPPVPSSMPIFSSFGNIDGRLQSRYTGFGTEVEVEDFWCTLDEVTADLYVGAWTFRGRLSLQVGYNVVFHERESVERWAGLVKGELVRGLGVDLDVEE